MESKLLTYVVLTLFLLEGLWCCQGCLEQERTALLQLKHFFNGPQSLRNWKRGDDNSDCCQWERVECNFTTGRVISLDLSFTTRITSTSSYDVDLHTFRYPPYDRELTLMFRTVLWYPLEESKSLVYLNASLFLPFEELKNLHLAGNGIAGCIENEGFLKLSKKLSNLEILNLRWNSFNSSILPSLSEISSLRSLYLAFNYKFQAFNHANDDDLEKLSRLGNLEVLDLSGIYFNYNILSFLSSFPSLKTLFLQGIILEANMSTRGFHNLSHIEELFLDFSILPTDFLHDIGALTSLKVLSLRECGLNGSLTGQGLCELTRLQDLDISYNYLGGALPSCLANLNSLQSLRLNSNTFFGDIALSPLNTLISLQFLSLSDNHFQIPISLITFFNHSKLKSIHAENNEFYADTIVDSLKPTFQLNTLVLFGSGDCGAIPNFLYSQHDLETLDLSHLSLTGEFPNWLLENNTKLKILSLVNNSLSGSFGPLFHSHMSLYFLDISKNFIGGHISMEIGASFPSLQCLNISGNFFTGSIPPSIGDMNSLRYLDFSHNNFSGEIPEKLSSGCSSLRILKLSNNSIQGWIFSANFSLFMLEELWLDSNQFSGSIPNSLSKCPHLSLIDFSNNNLSGTIPRWMGDMPSLKEIIMPNNGLKGSIPMEFCQIQQLGILNLSNNSVSGSLPSCFSPSGLIHVHLFKNRLEGPLTTQFCDSPSLRTLDLSDNQISGKIPDCIHTLHELSYLILKNNSFEGKIPIQLCKLQKLSLIDLSHNHLSGNMPSCLHITTFTEAYKVDWTATSAPPALAPTSAPPALPPTSALAPTFSTDEPLHFTTKNMQYSYKGRILTYMSGLDLSCNKLTGEIPFEIGHLGRIKVLNLSHNILVGPIPPTFSNLVQIESLDLSYNNLSGKIPPQLVELNFLSVFSVAYNNLSGMTPPGIQQFATFNESSYQGNPLLCGEPMKSCLAASPPPLIQEGPTQGGEDDGFLDMVAFYVSFIVSYMMVLITIATVLYINPYWRQAWFYYIEMCFFSSYYFIVDHLPKQFHSRM